MHLRTSAPSLCLRRYHFRAPSATPVALASAGGPPPGPVPKKPKLAAGRTVMPQRSGPSAVGTPPVKQKSGKGEAKNTGAFRFWTDARRFKGSEEKCLMQQALYESGGVRTGGYPKAAPIPGPLGCQRPSDWDLLWSPARLALKALPVKPGQLISAMPGMMSVTRKRKLSLTLKEAYGKDAFQIMPRTFSLPDELEAWRQYIATASAEAQAGSASGDSQSDSAGDRAHPASASTSGSSDPRQQLWILKTAQHLGKGLKLLPAEEAVQEAARNKSKGRAEKPYVQAQQYVANPLLIQGRKFGIRVWVLVTGHNPLRAYVHTNGLVLFSTHRYSSDVWSTEQGGVALGHVTNYAQNMDGMVWNLHQLQSHLGDASYQQLWDRISRNTAWVFSAALPHVQAQHLASGALPGSTFELLGLDYLVDEDLHPWLLEVNGTPSLAVEHENAEVEKLIHEQKMGMVRDMVSILNVRERFAPRYAAMKLALARHGIRSTAGTHVSSSSDAEDAGADDGLSEDGEAGVGSEQPSRRSAAGADASEGEASAWADNAEGGDARTAAAKDAQDPAVKTALVRKRLREQMSPASDPAVWSRVRRELQQRGDFQPLMAMFPVARQAQAAVVVPGPVKPSAAAVDDGSGGGRGIPWDSRDVEMVALMGKLRRTNSSGASAGASSAKSSATVE